jgi:sigma-E factor negative regulatory protein RseC
MEQIGEVVELRGREALVRIQRTSACGENCANCKCACEATTAVSVVENSVGAAVGDIVKIQSDSSAVLRAALILYIVPVLVAIISAVIGSSFSVICGIVFCVAMFFVSFFVIKLFEKKITPKSYITKVLGKEVK